MFCRVCGQQVNNNAVVCLNCGHDPRNGENFCPNCGQYCGANLTRTAPVPETFRQPAPCKYKKEKFLALLLAFFLGSLGLHCFYLDNSNKGVTMLLITILLAPMLMIGPLITFAWSLLDFIRIAFMSNARFERFVENKEW